MDEGKTIFEIYNDIKTETLPTICVEIIDVTDALMKKHGRYMKINEIVKKNDKNINEIKKSGLENIVYGLRGKRIIIIIIIICKK